MRRVRWRSSYNNRPIYERVNTNYPETVNLTPYHAKYFARIAQALTPESWQRLDGDFTQQRHNGDIAATF